MNAPHRFSLVSRLRLLLWAMVLLPILAGTGFLLLHSGPALRAEAARDMSAALSLERRFIEQWLLERTRDIDVFAADPRVLTLRESALRQMLVGMLAASPGFNDLAYVDASGRIRADARHAVGVDVSDRPYFKAAREGKSYISDVLLSRTTGDRVFVVSTPLKSADGTFRGLVFGSVSLDALSALMRIMAAESTSRSSLLQADGTLIAPAEQGRALAAGDALFDRARARTLTNDAYRDRDGVRMVGTYQWLRGGAWLLVAERSEADVLTTHAWVLGVPLGGALLVFALLGPMVLRLAGSLGGPILRMVEHARQIEAGNFEVDCVYEDERSTPCEVQRLNQAYCLMVARVRDALEALRNASYTDHLTGAANRKLLFHEGPRLLDLARRTGQPVSVLMLDLDHFKRVNDTHGHAAGDAVLVAFSTLLLGTLRKSDLLVRYGGEEFVVLAPNAGLAAARELGERIRAGVERLEVPVQGAVVRFTVSIGVCTLATPCEPAAFKPEREPLEELLLRADEALYAAKAAGRNRVEALPLAAAPEAAARCAG